MARGKHRKEGKEVSAMVSVLTRVLVGILALFGCLATFSIVGAASTHMKERGKAKQEALRLEADRFIEHCQNGEVDQVRAMLANGTDIHANATDNANRLGYTPLVWAVTRFQAAVVDVLLDHTDPPPNVEERTAWGTSPLSLCCWRPEQKEFAGKNVEIAQLLIDKGKADVNGLTTKGWTPLMHAAAHCELELMQLLISRGAWIHNFEKHDSEYEFNGGVDEEETARKTLLDWRMIIKQERDKFVTMKQPDKVARCDKASAWAEKEHPRVVPIPGPGERANVTDYVPKEKWHHRHDEL